MLSRILQEKKFRPRGSCFYLIQITNIGKCFLKKQKYHEKFSLFLQKKRKYIKEKWGLACYKPT